MALVAACGIEADVPPSAPPPLESIVGTCGAAQRDITPAVYRCIARTIREEPLYRNEDRDLYDVLAARADQLAEGIERRRMTVVEARLQWETAKSAARTEVIRRALPATPPEQPPGP
jgi:hypothetical protein